MNTLSIGQCLTSYGNIYVISAITLEEGKVSYTMLGLTVPTRSVLFETSLRFYRESERVLSLNELRDRRREVEDHIDSCEARKLAEETARREANERESCNPENAGLLTIDAENNTTKLAAKNIRFLLKKNFPGVKFSVRKSSHSCINVNWTDGPTRDAVENVVDKFQEGSFNGMEDIYEYKTSPFNRVYGGVQYLFCERSLSDALITEAIERLRKKYSLTVVPEDVTLETYKKGAFSMRGHEYFSHGLSSEIRKTALSIDKYKR